MLEVKNLKKTYSSGHFKKEFTLAVEDVSFYLGKGKVLGIVGESGSGKSTVARCLVRLVEPTSGKIFFKGKEITGLPIKELNQIRKKMQMIFQDPDAALDPKMTIRKNLEETLKFLGKKFERKEMEAILFNAIQRVGLSKEHLNRYPHQLSGGQNQRVVLARALFFNPELLIADEPTASLDVSVQAQILSLLKGFQREEGLSIMLISHDMEIVRHFCDDVAVMYHGKILEMGSVQSVFNNPKNPYTRLLLNCNEKSIEEWLDFEEKWIKR